MLLSQVIVGYRLAALARRLSPATLADYTVTHRKLIAYLDDPPFASITVAQLRAFLAEQTHLSKKTLLNYHIGLSALWTWAVNEGLAASNPVRQVERPRPEIKPVIPFSREDVAALLKAARQSQTYERAHTRPTSHTPPMALRNRAIILLLLDTGIRASELANLRRGDVDLDNSRITVMGKGSRGRIIPISRRTVQALWRYDVERQPGPGVKRFFLSQRGGGLSRDGLSSLFRSLGERAAVAPCHAHRFRHTFAINILRNGGNIYVLQRLLGHSTLDMVKRYLHIAQVDLDQAHASASPVANWRL